MIQNTRGEKKAALITRQSSAHHPAGDAGAVVDSVKSTAQTAGSRSWSSSALKNPRIVRVSRTFGGKDRHSKVKTIRGLRDRRVRLSVPTAIQLYDLQDKLGLNQPSKVVDWLLNAAQHEINKLPPLEMLHLMAAGDPHHHHLLFDQLPPQPNSSTSQPFDFGCTSNPVDDHCKIRRAADGEKAKEAGNFLKRSKESSERSIYVDQLSHGHGFALENGNPNNYYYSVESSTSPASNNANNNYLISQISAAATHHQVLHPAGYHHPIAILASYMAAASNYNASNSGGLKIMHEASNSISVPGLMPHDLSKDTAAAAAAARVLRHQF